MSEFDGSPRNPESAFFDSLGVKYAESYAQLPVGGMWEPAEDGLTVDSFLAIPKREEGEDDNPFNRLVHTYGRAFYMVPSEAELGPGQTQRMYAAFGDAIERQRLESQRNPTHHLSEEQIEHNKAVFADFDEIYGDLEHGRVITNELHVPAGYSRLFSRTDRETILHTIQFALRPGQGWCVMPTLGAIGEYDYYTASLWVESDGDTMPLPIARMTRSGSRWLTLIQGDKKD